MLNVINKIFNILSKLNIFKFTYLNIKIKIITVVAAIDAAQIKFQKFQINLYIKTAIISNYLAFW